jgi:hypothetical protein
MEGKHVPPAKLTGVRKLVKGNGRRRTRFHTERGEVIPMTAWKDIASGIRQRLTNVRDGPWITPAARAFLADHLSEHMNVLELGSGASTAWIAERAGHLTSFESDGEWAAAVRAEIASRRLTNVSLELTPIDDLGTAVASLKDGDFDVAIIDHAETPRTSRLNTTRLVASKLTAGGLLLLDDSDRSGLQPAARLLKDWECHRFVGMKPFPLMANETSIFVRVAGASLPDHRDIPNRLPPG